MRREVLNPRLSVVAEFVRQGAKFADIGTDHAYLPLSLLADGKISEAVCSDINEGPLDSARRNAAERGFSDKCEFVLTDGASALAGKGITDYAICGMGGELIADIISRAPHLKDESLSLVLQPMSRQSALRKYLASDGFSIVAEGYSCDAGRYYVCMLVKYTGRIRYIDDVEAELGAENIDIVNKDMQISYLEIKKASLTRSAEGKRAGGYDAEGDEALVAKIEEKIRKVREEK